MYRVAGAYLADVNGEGKLAIIAQGYEQVGMWPPVEHLAVSTDTPINPHG